MTPAQPARVFLVDGGELHILTTNNWSSPRVVLDQNNIIWIKPDFDKPWVRLLRAESEDVLRAHECGAFGDAGKAFFHRGMV